MGWVKPYNIAKSSCKRCGLNAGQHPESVSSAAVKSADQTQAMMRTDYERWSEVVLGAGIKAQ